jgi:hypothetical protein
VSLFIAESDGDAGQDGFVQRMQRVLRCRKREVPALVMCNSNRHLTFLGGNRVKYVLEFENLSSCTEVLFVDILL